MTTVRTDNPFPDIPLTEGTYEGESGPSRYRVGTRRNIGRADIPIESTKWHDGRMEVSHRGRR